MRRTVGMVRPAGVPLTVLSGLVNRPGLGADAAQAG